MAELSQAMAMAMATAKAMAIVMAILMRVVLLSGDIEKIAMRLWLSRLLVHVIRHVTMRALQSHPNALEDHHWSSRGRQACDSGGLVRGLMA